MQLAMPVRGRDGPCKEHGLRISSVSKSLVLAGAFFLSGPLAWAQGAEVASLSPQAGAAPAVTPRVFDTSAANLMVILRQAPGANQRDEALQPVGKRKARSVDGQEFELEPGWYGYVGDLQVRLVFDSPESVQTATAQDLQRLGLTPQQAIELGIRNLKRVYGAPVASQWSGGTMQVEGNSEYLHSSYFLDREFWRALEKQHPEGIVVAVPQRGGLVYAPLADTEAVATLRIGTAWLVNTGWRSRLSSALYLFKGDRWSVYQPPVQR